MRRGDVLVAVNFGETAVTVAVGEREVLFGTPSGVTVSEGTMTLPATRARCWVRDNFSRMA